MSHRYLVAILGLSLLTMGVIYGESAYVVGWLGVNFIVLAVGHICAAPTVFGKHQDGRLAWWSWLFFFPLHVYTMLIWHLVCRLSRESAYDQVGSALIIGRRLLPHEVGFQVENYLDLTAEFSEPSAVRNTPGYVSFPILDGSVPNKVDLDRLLKNLRVGRTFIHCAQGHGRTGLVAAAYLLVMNHARNSEEAIGMLQKARPKLRLSREQKTFLKQYGNGA